MHTTAAITIPLCICFDIDLLAACSPSQALEKYNIEKDIAAFVKKEFDKKYNPTWHVIVGRNFGENERNAPFNFTTSCLTISIFPLQAHM